MRRNMNDKKDKEKNPPYFTAKRKGIAAIVSLGAAVLWVILWFVFPMEFYSLFFASNIGSTLFLAAMAAVITFPACFICTKALSKDISVPLHLGVNIVGMVGCIFLYSIFRFTAVWWLILALAVHLGAMAAVFVTAPAIKVNRVKEKKGRLASALAGIVCALCSDFIYLLLFNVLLETFREN